MWQRHISYNGPCKPGSQQTRDAKTMLARYWPEIVDGGPTSTQHRINVLCLPGCQIQLEYHDKTLAILTCPRGSAMTRASELLQYRCARRCWVNIREDVIQCRASTRQASRAISGEVELRRRRTETWAWFAVGLLGGSIMDLLVVLKDFIRTGP